MADIYGNIYFELFFELLYNVQMDIHTYYCHIPLRVKLDFDIMHYTYTMISISNFIPRGDIKCIYNIVIHYLHVTIHGSSVSLMLTHCLGTSKYEVDFVHNYS